MKKLVKIITVALLCLISIASFAKKDKEKKEKYHKGHKSYFVTINYNKKIDAKFNILLPEERALYAKYHEKGIIEEGLMVPNHSKGWMIIHGTSAGEVYRLMKEFPLFDYMSIEIDELDDEKLSQFSL